MARSTASVISGPAAGAQPHRPVRSFVLRQGRISEAQERALATLMPRFGLPFQAAPLDCVATFGRRAPVILEIGFGMGEATAAIAHAHPQHDYLGIEVHAPGVGALLLKAEALALQNLRIIRHDAVEVVDRMVPQGSLAGIHVYFPDPWPKKRHHKRRLLQPSFVASLAQRLEPGGYLHAATDWEEYAQAILAIAQAQPLLGNTADGFAPRPQWRPQTKFETRGMRLGHGVFDVLFRRR